MAARYMRAASSVLPSSLCTPLAQPPLRIARDQAGRRPVQEPLEERQVAVAFTKELREALQRERCARLCEDDLGVALDESVGRCRWRGSARRSHTVRVQRARVVASARVEVLRPGHTGQTDRERCDDEVGQDTASRFSTALTRRRTRSRVPRARVGLLLSRSAEETTDERDGNWGDGARCHGEELGSQHRGKGVQCGGLGRLARAGRPLRGQRCGKEGPRLSRPRALRERPSTSAPHHLAGEGWRGRRRDHREAPPAARPRGPARRRR